jgi:hypothetical protein
VLVLYVACRCHIASAWTGVQMEAHFIVDTLMATFGFGVWVVHEKLFCNEIFLIWITAWTIDPVRTDSFYSFGAREREIVGMDFSQKRFSYRWTHQFLLQMQMQCILCPLCMFHVFVVGKRWWAGWVGVRHWAAATSMYCHNEPLSLFLMFQVLQLRIESF